MKIYQNIYSINCQSFYFKSQFIHCKGWTLLRKMDPRHYLANYEIEQEIGQGSFATVFLGHEKVSFYDKWNFRLKSSINF